MFKYNILSITTFIPCVSASCCPTCCARLQMRRDIFLDNCSVCTSHFPSHRITRHISFVFYVLCINLQSDVDLSELGISFHKPKSEYSDRITPILQAVVWNPQVLQYWQHQDHKSSSCSDFWSCWYAAYFSIWACYRKSTSPEDICTDPPDPQAAPICTSKIYQK